MVVVVVLMVKKKKLWDNAGVRVRTEGSRPFEVLK